MKTFKRNLKIAMLALLAFGAAGNVEEAKGQVNFSGNMVTGYLASSLGSGNTSSGNRSFTSGYGNTVNAYMGTAFGRENIVSGSYGIGLGYSNHVTGYGSAALGFDNGTTANYSYTIGKKMNNNIPESFMVGFNNTANSNPTLFVNSSRVGVNTSNPKEAFQIGDRWTFHDGGVKYIGYNSDYNGSTNIRIENGGANQFVMGDWGMSFNVAGWGNTGSEIEAKTALNIDHHGRVSVGDGVTKQTTSGNEIWSYNLFVEKGILTEKVKVALQNTSGWADHVFMPDYKLLPLEEVETHIIENGHLHKQPSAKELVQDGGFELGEMAAMQQEKIEEIYLHLIDMNKELKSLKAENDALKSELESLKK